MLIAKPFQAKKTVKFIERPTGKYDDTQYRQIVLACRTDFFGQKEKQRHPLFSMSNAHGTTVIFVERITKQHT